MHEAEIFLRHTKILIFLKSILILHSRQHGSFHRESILIILVNHSGHVIKRPLFSASATFLQLKIRSHSGYLFLRQSSVHPVNNVYRHRSHLGKINKDRSNGGLVKLCLIHIVKTGNADILRNIYASFPKFFTNGKCHVIIGTYDGLGVSVSSFHKPIDGNLSFFPPIISVKDHMLRYGYALLFHGFQKSLQTLRRIPKFLFSGHIANVTKSMILQKMSGHILHRLLIFQQHTVKALPLCAKIYHRALCMLFQMGIHFITHSLNVKDIFCHDNAAEFFVVGQIHTCLFSL